MSVADPWVAWQQDVIEQLRSLDDRGFVNTWGPSIEVEGRGLLGRLQGRRPWAPGVNVLRIADHFLVVSCTPSRHEPQWLDNARARLRGTGWTPQPEHVEPSDELVRYEPVARPDSVAALAARTYPLLRVATPDLVATEVVPRG